MRGGFLVLAALLALRAGVASAQVGRQPDAMDLRPPVDGIDVRASAEHRLLPGDTPEVAAQLALADARRKASIELAARLRPLAGIARLRLSDEHLEAYAAPLVEIEDSAVSAVTDGHARAQVRVQLESETAVLAIANFVRDQDWAVEILAAASAARRLHETLADLARRRTAATGGGVQPLLEERSRTLTELRVRELTARAYAALTRTQPVTVGGRATPTAGRDRARRLAAAASLLSPDSPAARYLQGDLLIEAEQPAAAENEYRNALDADPGSSMGRTKLAAALRYQDRMPDAIAELRAVIAADPAFARAHGDLGMILRAQRDFPAAIAAYQEAVRLDPESTDAHNGLAVTLANSGRLEEAVAEFREIIRIDPDSTIGYYNLAYALADLDRDVESAAALREVIRIYPDHYNARFNLGELFRLEQKYDDAAAQFREYLRLAPATPQNQRNIRRAQGYIRQFEDPDAPAVVETMSPPRRP